MIQNAPYEQFVKSIAKSGVEILVQLTPLQASMIHMAIGVSGEAGELLDAIKKHAIYQKQLDLENVKEEAGDILFYLTGLLNDLGLTLNECLEANVEKLSRRYPERRYTNEAAIARADKASATDNHQIKTLELVEDDDLAEVVIEKVCQLNEPDCESCK